MTGVRRVLSCLSPDFPYFFEHFLIAAPGIEPSWGDHGEEFLTGVRRVFSAHR
jgi:hypothetical protein